VNASGDAERGGRTPGSRWELLAAEDAGWSEVGGLVGSLSLEYVERSGYFPEGWSVKDLMAHLGSWLAEAGLILERIRVGTYRPEEIDVERMNDQFLEALRDVPYSVVRAQAASARARMLQAWQALSELTDEAAFWIRKAGADHYDEHLPRLREWVQELHGSG
jgi:Mycothiol maleylpyruvate isomerase N-terminal domain